MTVARLPFAELQERLARRFGSSSRFQEGTSHRAPTRGRSLCSVERGTFFVTPFQEFIDV
ncbi:MAG: hypothetical protein NTV94_18320 [Planctomycetota bacterium]|nr:hypothetical protein [Planctomycetota bacterium]